MIARAIVHVGEPRQNLRLSRSSGKKAERFLQLTPASSADSNLRIGKTQIARAIDSPEECIRLYFALMIVGCEEDLSVLTIVAEGRAILSSFIGAAVGIALIVFARHGRNVQMPFGPYLGAAGIVALFWGPQLTRQYLYQFM